jgi:hypothetical protein
MDFDTAFSSQPLRRDILSKASGQWPHLLRTLGGLQEHYLSGAHQPCPCCHGDDRYRWITDDGPGGWFCTHCAGKDQRGGGGSGIDLLMRLRNWSFRQAIKQVKLYYDGLPFQPTVKQVAPLPKPSTAGLKHSELERFLLLELAGQLTDNEFFSPAGARQRIYSRRWAAYASVNYDQARSAVLQFETERGIVDELEVWPGSSIPAVRQIFAINP